MTPLAPPPDSDATHPQPARRGLYHSARILDIHLLESIAVDLQDRSPYRFFMFRAPEVERAYVEFHYGPNSRRALWLTLVAAVSGISHIVGALMHDHLPPWVFALQITAGAGSLIVAFLTLVFALRRESTVPARLGTTRSNIVEKLGGVFLFFHLVYPLLVTSHYADCVMEVRPSTDVKAINLCVNRINPYVLLAMMSLFVVGWRSIFIVPFEILVPISYALGRTIKLAGPESSYWLSLAITAMLSVIICFVSVVLDHFHRRHFRDFVMAARHTVTSQTVQARLDETLRAMLPEHVLSRLESGKPVLDVAPLATISICEIHDFAMWATTVLPAVAVQAVHTLSASFAQYCCAYRISELKATGDRYICGTGLLNDAALDDGIRVVNFGFLQMHFMNALNAQIESPLYLRIAIHTGAFFGAIVGSDNLNYNLFGEAIQTATDMIEVAARGAILISNTTYAIVCGSFAVVPGPAVELSGATQRRADFPPASAAEIPATSSTQHQSLSSIDASMATNREQSPAVPPAATAATTTHHPLPTTGGSGRSAVSSTSSPTTDSQTARRTSVTFSREVTVAVGGATPQVSLSSPLGSSITATRLTRRRSHHSLPSATSADDSVLPTAPAGTAAPATSDMRASTESEGSTTDSFPQHPSMSKFSSAFRDLAPATSSRNDDDSIEGNSEAGPVMHTASASQSQSHQMSQHSSFSGSTAAPQTMTTIQTFYIAGQLQSVAPPAPLTFQRQEVAIEKSVGLSRRRKLLKRLGQKYQRSDIWSKVTDGSDIFDIFSTYWRRREEQARRSADRDDTSIDLEALSEILVEHERERRKREKKRRRRRMGGATMVNTVSMHRVVLARSGMPPDRDGPRRHGGTFADIANASSSDGGDSGSEASTTSASNSSSATASESGGEEHSRRSNWIGSRCGQLDEATPPSTDLDEFVSRTSDPAFERDFVRGYFKAPRRVRSPTGYTTRRRRMLAASGSGRFGLAAAATLRSALSNALSRRSGNSLHFGGEDLPPSGHSPVNSQSSIASSGRPAMHPNPLTSNNLNISTEMGEGSNNLPPAAVVTHATIPGSWADARDDEMHEMTRAPVAEEGALFEPTPPLDNQSSTSVATVVLLPETGPASRTIEEVVEKAHKRLRDHSNSFLLLDLAFADRATERSFAQYIATQQASIAQIVSILIFGFGISLLIAVVMDNAVARRDREADDQHGPVPIILLIAACLMSACRIWYSKHPACVARTLAGRFEGITLCVLSLLFTIAAYAMEDSVHNGSFSYLESIFSLAFALSFARLRWVAAAPAILVFSFGSNLVAQRLRNGSFTALSVTAEALLTVMSVILALRHELLCRQVFVWETERIMELLVVREVTSLQEAMLTMTTPLPDLAKAAVGRPVMSSVVRVLPETVVLEMCLHNIRDEMPQLYGDPVAAFKRLDRLFLIIDLLTSHCARLKRVHACGDRVRFAGPLDAEGADDGPVPSVVQKRKRRSVKKHQRPEAAHSLTVGGAPPSPPQPPPINVEEIEREALSRLSFTSSPITAQLGATDGFLQAGGASRDCSRTSSVASASLYPPPPSHQLFAVHAAGVGMSSMTQMDGNRSAISTSGVDGDLANSRQSVSVPDTAEANTANYPSPPSAFLDFGATVGSQPSNGRLASIAAAAGGTLGSAMDSLQQHGAQSVASAAASRTPEVALPTSRVSERRLAATIIEVCFMMAQAQHVRTVGDGMSLSCVAVVDPAFVVFTGSANSQFAPATDPQEQQNRPATMTSTCFSFDVHGVAVRKCAALLSAAPPGFIGFAESFVRAAQESPAVQRQFGDVFAPPSKWRVRGVGLTSVYPMERVP